MKSWGPGRIGILLLALLSLWASAIVRAAPTPGPDGRILYSVKPGNTRLQISLLYGVSIDYSRTTNYLALNCTLQAGKSIAIGGSGPTAASPTPSPVQPTATPSVGGTAEICVELYKDIDGDGIYQAAHE